jgi:hypothetical protein
MRFADWLQSVHPKPGSSGAWSICSFSAALFLLFLYVRSGFAWGTPVGFAFRFGLDFFALQMGRIIAGRRDDQNHVR